LWALRQQLAWRWRNPPNRLIPKQGKPMASSKKFGKSGSSKNQSMVLWLGIALLVLLLDQFTKVLVLGAFQLGDSTPITSFFNLVRVHNHGAAFSFLAGAGGWQRWFFTGIGVVAALFMVWMLRAHPGQKLFSLAIALILGGAIGNVIDRLLHGYVVDFLDFYWGAWHFPAFNVADSGITVGAALLILDEILRVRRGR
jgi:signal peptidase II